MEPAQIIAAVLGSSVLGGVITNSMDWIRESSSGQLQERRAEVDKATQHAAHETKRADAAEAAEDAAARRSRIVEESLAVHRRLIIDAPCLGPEYLPPYPSRKD